MINKFKNKIRHLIGSLFQKIRRIEADNDWDMSDTFLVTFPKSGTTWVSFLIARSLQIYNKDNRRLDFMNLHDYVPDFHANPEYIKSKAPPRVIKTHEDFYSHKSRIDIKGKGVVYPKYILIIRSGVDSMKSFYSYKNALGYDLKSFKSFCKNVNGTREDWGFHTESWVNQKTINKKYILEIRYEDLLEDTPKSLSKILDFIGITLSQDNLKEAVRYCDISNMRKLEENYGDGVNYSDKSFNFTRREKLRNIDIISDEEIKSYQESNKALLEKMKYL